MIPIILILNIILMFLIPAGMFHWCPSRELSSCLLDRQEAAMTVLQVRN